MPFHTPIYHLLSIETFATKTITDLRAETYNTSSMLVSWSLSESNSYDSEGEFSIYLGFGNLETLAGKTKSLFFEILGLAQNFNYTVRVELQYPYSALIISATTHHLLALSGGINPNVVKIEPITSFQMYTFIAVIVTFITILIFVLLICIFIPCAMKRRRRSKVNPLNYQIKLPKLHACDILQHDCAANPMKQSNKAFLCTENVEATEAKEIELDLKAPISVDSDNSFN